MEIVYLDGAFLPADQAKVSVFDRGFLFGDSVYEVIPFYQGVGFRLEEHLARLAHSLDALQIPHSDNLDEALNKLVAQNGGGNVSVYVQITRGNAGKRSHAVTADITPTVFACCQPIAPIYETGPEVIEGARVIVTDDLRWQRCDIKANGLLANILAMRQAHEAGAAEALLQKEGWINEGSSSNVFIVEQGHVITPPLHKGILSGTTRALVLELAQQHGVQVTESNISYERLIGADEVWITSSTRGVLPVTAVDEHLIAGGQKGPLWLQMFKLFTRYQQGLMTGESL
ncbi:D-amino acid aminotransferase [Neptunomonas sp. XY-337]|uniref:D-amino acid aminotransferase n=1 Tax=Neptunomonas sp. XY-337 TaxID=2561897 RepID=UPI0010A99B05|nr:D-amino acid aminotransferase [Neptunomonas sp. XY-337]